MMLICLFEMLMLINAVPIPIMKPHFPLVSVVGSHSYNKYPSEVCDVAEHFQFSDKLVKRKDSKHFTELCETKMDPTKYLGFYVGFHKCYLCLSPVHKITNANYITSGIPVNEYTAYMSIPISVGSHSYYKYSSLVCQDADLVELELQNSNDFVSACESKMESKHVGFFVGHGECYNCLSRAPMVASVGYTGYLSVPVRVGSYFYYKYSSHICEEDVTTNTVAFVQLKNPNPVSACESKMDPKKHVGFFVESGECHNCLSTANMSSSDEQKTVYMRIMPRHANPV